MNDIPLKKKKNKIKKSDVEKFVLKKKKKKKFRNSSWTIAYEVLEIAKVWISWLNNNFWMVKSSFY